ncbi:Gfo/Idh/MocA family oxidoreductase [Flavobacteriales bacterium]|nr:Gfo/Idh/MocA family oxidoreductase [Flavobacteriales bacterium]
MLRRNFVKSGGVVIGSALTFPNILACKNLNSRLNIALIGVGGRGIQNWQPIINSENIVAMCDVDDRWASKALTRIKESHANVKRFKDYRVMFDKMQNLIDAVIISTPDHTHFHAAITAMELGIHVCIEKPLAHNVWQCRTLKKAANHYGVISQMANQGHTTNGIRQVKEWYEAGILGEVREVHAWFGEFNFKAGHWWDKPSEFPPKKQAIPKTLDWNLWLGPAKDRNYNKVYVPKSWRGFFDFGNGQLGDWSCHTLDAPFWALNLGMPSSVFGNVPDPRTKENFVADKSTVEFTFPANNDRKPVKLKWYEGGFKPNFGDDFPLKNIPNLGMVMIGSKNSLITGGRPNNPRLLVSEEEWTEFKKNPPKQKIPRLKSGDETPIQEWIDGIKNNFLPESNFNYSAELTEMALIGVLSQRFGGKIDYDAEKMQIINRPELNKFLREEARDGWKVSNFYNSLK